MLLCHFKFSFKEDKLNFRFIGTLSVLHVREHVKRHYCKKELFRKILSPGRINVVKNEMYQL